MIRRLLQLGVISALASACSVETIVLPTPLPPVPPPSITELDGNWRAIQFIVEPANGSAQDVLAAGGEISLNIASSKVNGAMRIPASVAGNAVTADMGGTIVFGKDSANFVQPVDTFVRRVTWWRHDARVLYIISQPVQGTKFTVVLLRDIE